MNFSSLSPKIIAKYLVGIIFLAKRNFFVSDNLIDSLSKISSLVID
jgi:hypothetical protein